MKVRTVSPFPDIPKRLEVEGPAFMGGEGEVYFSRCGQFVVKVYHDRMLPQDKEKMLEKVLFLGRNLGEDTKLLCWPLALVKELEGRRKIGVVTRKVPCPPFQELVDVVFSPREFKRAVERGANWLHYLQVAHSLAKTVAVLHGKGCAHADLHFKNFLVDLKNGRSVLIDLDGLVVPGFLPPQVAGMMPFMAPEVIRGFATPNEKTDRHSLAVLIFHTLLFRNPLQPLICYDPEDEERDEKIGWGEQALFSEHPFDFRHRPLFLGRPLFRRGVLSYSMFPPFLRHLVERSFLEGLFVPERRPLAREWEQALLFSFFTVWRCKQCTQYFFYPYWLPFFLRRCPFCGKRVEFPYPLLGRLYGERSSEVAASRGEVVLGHRFQVVGKMFQERCQDIFGETLWREKGYSFRNLSTRRIEWLSPFGSSGYLEEGEEILLERGMLLDFGGYFLEVKEDGCTV